MFDGLKLKLCLTLFAMAMHSGTSGAIGGAADESGGEYRRALAALFIAHALHGATFRGIPVDRSVTIESIRVEADTPVDDIVVGFVTGKLYVQAKRRLTFGRSFDEVVSQWIRAVRDPDFDSARDMLGVGSAHISRPLKLAGDATHRRRLDPGAAWTQNEESNVEKVRSVFTKLGATPAEVDLIFRSTVFIERAVEEEHEDDAQVGRLLLDGHVVDIGYGDRAWRELISAVGHAARLRIGFSVEDWAAELRRRDLPLVADSAGSRAARIEKRRRAVDHYRYRLQQAGDLVDLTGLGAKLPPLPLKLIDADITVREPSSDERSRHELLWAFHRRGRVILTGPPGGGKSTALRAAAGEWARRHHWTTPIVVSLRRLADDDHFRRRSLRENILDLAVEKEPPEDKDLVRECLDQGLSQGNVVLFLDGLDEAADRSLRLAADIRDLLSTIHPDTDVLIATRDAAYSDAAILEFRDLVLNEPRDIKPTVRAVLDAIADQHASATTERWVEERLDWVNGVLDVDSQLGETPLIPVLLALLAGEHDMRDLPSTRATILLKAIDGVVERHEVNREISLNALPQGHQSAALIDAFPRIAAVLALSNGTAPRNKLTEDLAPHLTDQWGLAPALARTTANEVVRFWDEAGVFVAQGASRMTSPRTHLFLEIGAARDAASKPPQEARTIVRDWAADKDRREALILAAGLSQPIAEALIDHAEDGDDEGIVVAAAEALAQGGQASAPHVRQLGLALIRAMSPADDEAWRRFKQLFRIPVPDDLRQHAVEKLDAFGPDHIAVGRTLAAIEWGLFEGDRETTLEGVLRIDSLPALPTRGDLGLRQQILRGGVDQTFMHCKVEAAAELIPHRPDLAQIVADSMNSASMWASREMEKILENEGHSDLAERAVAQFSRAFDQSFFDRADSFEEEILKTLTMIAHLAPPSNLTKSQERRLNDLGEFVETLNLNDMSSWPSHGTLDDMREPWYRLILGLGGFDASILAAQAQLVSRELAWDAAGQEDKSHPRGAYFSLFDGSRPRDLEHWENIDDIQVGSDLAVHLLGGGSGLAVVAAGALANHPDRDGTGYAIERRLTDVDHRSTRAAVWAALKLSNQRDEAIRRLAEHGEPAVRAAVASLCDLLDDDQPTVIARGLATDSERSVQNAALDRLEEEADFISLELAELLREISGAPPQPFKCNWCGVENSAWRRSCESCNVVQERPDKKALKLLEEIPTRAMQKQTDSGR